MLTGLRIDEYFARTDSSNNQSTFLSDSLGSTIGLVGSSGMAGYTYEPFGATSVGGTPSSNSYQFTGRENDGTSLYYYRARYYSPTLQRFIAEDPLGFLGGDSDLYAYVLDNPALFVDPLGLYCLSNATINAIAGAVGGAVVAATGMRRDRHPRRAQREHVVEAADERQRERRRVVADLGAQEGRDAHEGPVDLVHFGPPALVRNLRLLRP